jgi:hypothetical protein
VFSLEEHSDLGEWMPSTVENAMRELAGTFAEDVYSSKWHSRLTRDAG